MRSAHRFGPRTSGGIVTLASPLTIFRELPHATNGWAVVTAGGKMAQGRRN